jgi:major membrane immunogen (membrane-anchored lipoprotein)
MKKLLILTSAILLIAAACNKQPVNNGGNQNNNNQGNNNQNSQSSVYENDYMKVTLVDGWTAKQAGSNPSAVNITKGNYILYINTQATQASGVTGGRFAEIAQGAPSADAVVTVQPSPPCGTSNSTDITIGNAGYKRVDLFIDNTEKKSYCVTPGDGEVGKVWYFSYVSDYRNGYINYYSKDTPPGLVITMAYNSKNVGNFPMYAYADLNTNLAEMTTITQSLVIKK